MTASKKPKTPSMIMKVRAGVSPEDVQLFCKRASRLCLSQVVNDIVVTERLTVERSARRTNFTVRMDFFPEEEYREEYVVDPPEILECFGTRFPLILKKEIMTEMKRLDGDLRSQISELGKGKKKPKDGEQAPETEEGDEEPKHRQRGDDEESEAGDGDADDAKRARQHKEQGTYEEDDEDEEDEEEAGETDGNTPSENADEPPQVKSRLKNKSLENQVHAVAELFQANLHFCTSFDFDSTGCTFKLEVCVFKLDVPFTYLSSSSAQRCQNCCLSALSNEHVGRLSFVKYLGSRIVSK